MYVSKRIPRAHQQKALDHLKDQKSFAILMAMRTGKTKVISDDWGRLAEEGKVRDLLVIAPAGAYIPWREALKADLPDALIAKTRIFTWVSAQRKRKDVQKELADFIRYAGYRILLINIEAISSVAEAKWLCEKFLISSSGKNMCVIDESVIIKNPSSKCSNFCVDKLGQLAEYKRILSGLVAPRSPLDVYQQYKFLNPSIFPEKYSAFKENHVEYKRVCYLATKQVEYKYRNALKIPKDHPVRLTKDEMVEEIFKAGRYIPHIPFVKGYKNVERIAERIAPYSFRVKLEDCFDMPPSDYSFWDVELTTQQDHAYQEMRNFFSSEANNGAIVSASTIIVQMLRLHQILCGHTKDETGEIVSYPENRTKELLKILDDYDGKAIIWASYDENVKSISEGITKHFGKGSLARFWGGNRASRETEELDFKTNPDCRFMVATPDAGGRGRTWDNADLVIYYSSRNNLDHRAQSEERAKNIGKTRPISYIDMRVPGTVEDKIIEALRKKIDLAALVANDPKITNWII